MPNAPRQSRPPRISRPARHSYHRWYSLPAWRRLREEILSRQPLCAACLLLDVVTPATDVDHISPHRGNWSQFLRTENLQALCHRCHSAKTKAGN